MSVLDGDGLVHISLKPPPEGWEALCGIGSDAWRSANPYSSPRTTFTSVRDARCVDEAAKVWSQPPICPDCWRIWEERHAAQDHDHLSCCCPLSVERRKAFDQRFRAAYDHYIAAGRARDFKPGNPLWERFHQLWTAAAGRPTYGKEEWLEAEAVLGNTVTANPKMYWLSVSLGIAGMKEILPMLEET